MSKTLKLPVHKLSSTEPLETYGIDSILVVELATVLQGVFDNVSSTLFFEYRTIDELAAHFIQVQPQAVAAVLGQVPADGAATAAAAVPAAGAAHRVDAVRQPARRWPPVPRTGPAPALPPAARAASRDVAIVGLSGRYAQAGNVDEFWENLKQGRNCITDIPRERWDHTAYFDPRKGQPGKSYSKWGGFIDGIDLFDPLFFNIAPREAVYMDPQERLFLMEAYSSIEDAGYMPAALGAGGKVGVFVGVMNSNYGTGTRQWSIANRVSYLYNFQGPSMAVDTACSSSLTAVHLALESLRSGACDVAVAGGVNLIVDPQQYVALSAMNMLSAGDSCRAFGDQADGFVDGEGVGAVVLKPLEAAIADGDQIYGVIKASSINHGGKTNGYTVPNPHAQAAAIAGALAAAHIDPRTISYIEAHGTGTPLGDPIEIAGLSRAFGATRQAGQFCAIGSVKSNIGHCESAAGIASITKVLLQLKHGQIAPSLHTAALNTHIDFGATPFSVQRELGEWHRPMLEIDGRQVEVPRRAGVSSFGAGGSNAHLVIEEYMAGAARAPAAPGHHGAVTPVLVVLSAKNAERLRAQVQRLVNAIGRQCWKDEHLAGLAYTLQVGREPMEERLALAVDSMAVLCAHLEAWLAGDDTPAVYQGQVKRNQEAMALFAADDELQEAVSKWVERKKFSKVLELWVRGLAFDWNALYGEHKPQRLSLPSYPFAPERYWLDRNVASADLSGHLPAAFSGKPPASGPAPLADTDGAGAQLALLSPVWQPAIPLKRQAPAADGAMLIVGGSAVQQDILRRQYHAAQVADFAPCSSIDEMAAALAACGDFDQLLWIVPEAVATEPDDERMRTLQHEGVLHGFRLVKALLQAGYGSQALAWCVITTQTQLVCGDEAIAPAHAAIHGLIGAMAKEHPNWTVNLVDVADGGAWSITEMLAIAADPSGNSWAWRGGSWYRQHLVPAAVSGPAPAPYRQRGVYVVIGGAGGIGQAWSEHLIRDYQAQVVWLGRRPLDADIQAQIDRLARLGPAPHYIVADASVREALEAACDDVRQRFDTIHGVVHSALVLADRSLARMDEEQFASSLRAKVDISLRLAQVFGADGRRGALDFVLFFSSMQSFARAAGQSNYAAGCLFEDAFALRLSQLWRCQVKVINWGWWGSVGVAAGPTYQERMRQLGLASIEPEEGWQALSQLLGGQYAQLGLLKTTAPFPQERAPADTLAVAAGESVAPAGIDDAQLQERGVAALKQMVGALLHVPERQIDADQSLAEYGIDSISIGQLAGLLGPVFADVNSALFFDYRTINALVGHFLRTQRTALLTWVSPGAAAPTVQPPFTTSKTAETATEMAPKALPQTAAQADVGAIAIVGMACRFPGADSVEAYWQMLCDGAKADTHGPARRWPERYAARDEGGLLPRAAFLDDVDHFDAGFFGIAPLHAAAIDPQERLFMMSCWHALEDAGYGSDQWLAACSRDGVDVGVFVGVTAASYNLIGFEQSLAGNAQSPGLSFASVANHVSHALGLTGPSLSIDTMCSSSMVALHTACESLRRNECGVAIAGGVNLNLHPSRLEAMLQARLICEDGESRSFRAGGKGFLAGEGVAAVILKPLAAALRDGDTVRAVIRGSAVGHSGSTLNYFTPSPRGQGRVMAKALERAGVLADQVAYVEAQGVGDETTDGAECEAIKAGYQLPHRAGAPLRIGSVKPNVGHAEAAAGMAQLIKVVLQLEHGLLVPTLLDGPLNPHLRLAQANAEIQRDVASLAPLADGDAPLRAAINAFGAGGTAAHVIVESAPAPTRVRRPDEPQLLLLSARSPGALRRAAEALEARLANGGVELADVAYTLRIGRRSLPHRLALLADTSAAALALLRGWLAGRAEEGVFASSAQEISPRPADATQIGTPGNLCSLAHAWAGGAVLDWSKIQGERGHRVPLPGYAFDLQPHGASHGAGPVRTVSTAATAAAAVPSGHAEQAPASGGLLQSVTTPTAAAAYLKQQRAATAGQVQLVTVGMLYAVMKAKGVLFDENDSADGALAVYPRPAGDAAAAYRLLDHLLAGNEAGVDRAGGSVPGGERSGWTGRLAAQLMPLARQLLESLPEGLRQSTRQMSRLVPGAEGVPAAYLLRLLARTPFMVSDQHGARLALPDTIRRLGELDQLRGQYEIFLRALPEYQPYCALLAASVNGILDGQRPDAAQVTAASALIADMCTVPGKQAFLFRATADLCFAGRFTGRETIAVLAIGAGGFELLASLTASAPAGTRIEYRLVTGWPQVAQNIVELGKQRFPGVSFTSFVPMVPGALRAHLDGSHHDVVIVNLQDPCAYEAAGLLEQHPAGARDSLVLVTEPVETQGLALILDLASMWPQVLATHAMPGAGDLAAVLARAGYRRQVVKEGTLAVYSRAADPAAATMPGRQDTAPLAELRQFLLQTFSDACGDPGTPITPEQNLAALHLSSMTWALLFARLRQRFGDVIDREVFSGLGATDSIDTLAMRLADKLCEGTAQEPVPPLPEALSALVMERLVELGQTALVLASEDALTRRQFTSSRGQVIEYFECGSGQTLVMLTALAFSKSIWEQQIREFGQQYRLIFPHLPGHAGSLDTGVDFSFDQLADDLVELLDALAVTQANLVGWCMAGNIAQLLALRHPQRLASLTLVCTTPTDARMRGITRRELEDYAVSPMLTYQTELNNIYQEDFLAPDVAHCLALVNQSRVPVAPHALFNFIGNLFQFDTRSRLHEIRVPTLVVAGSHDIAFPVDQVALLSDAIRGSRLLVLDKSGHLPFLTQSTAFNAALRSFVEESIAGGDATSRG
ncbi:MAG: alpha/beta fold hydrolase [Janthinobacterium sp.]|nr:alpha/beta fold hydrolase [Janthinobacterium sp.]MCX7293678.1 alpha/beta fold hydrolase [Janthinobacterium sp.]